MKNGKATGQQFLPDSNQVKEISVAIVKFKSADMGQCCIVLNTGFKNMFKLQSKISGDKLLCSRHIASWLKHNDLEKKKRRFLG